MDVLFQKFANMSEYHRYLESGKVQPAFKKESSKNGSRSFTGTVSYGAADKLYLWGDEETAKRLDGNYSIKTMIRKYAATKPTTKKFVSVCGAVPHVPNYIAGIPTNMIAIKRVKVKERVMDVFFNMCIDCTVSTEEIIATTIELFKAIMSIESNGTRVNLYVGEAVINKSYDQVVGMAIKIKNATQPIDIVKMVYPLVNPSMLRRHHFRWMEITAGIRENFSDGYGRVNDKKTMPYVRKEMRNCHCVCFNEIRNMTCDSIVRTIIDN